MSLSISAISAAMNDAPAKPLERHDLRLDVVDVELLERRRDPVGQPVDVGLRAGVVAGRRRGLHVRRRQDGQGRRREGPARSRRRRQQQVGRRAVDEVVGEAVGEGLAVRARGARARELGHRARPVGRRGVRGRRGERGIGERRLVGDVTDLLVLAEVGAQLRDREPLLLVGHRLRRSARLGAGRTRCGAGAAPRRAADGAQGLRRCDRHGAVGAAAGERGGAGFGRTSDERGGRLQSELFEEVGHGVEEELPRRGGQA
jgi:hypothetical protein